MLEDPPLLRLKISAASSIYAQVYWNQGLDTAEKKRAKIEIQAKQLMEKGRELQMWLLILIKFRGSSTTRNKFETPTTFVLPIKFSCYGDSKFAQRVNQSYTKAVTSNNEQQSINRKRQNQAINNCFYKLALAVLLVEWSADINTGSFPLTGPFSSNNGIKLCDVVTLLFLLVINTTQT